MMEPHLVSLSDPHYMDPLPGSNPTPSSGSRPAPRPPSAKHTSKLQTESLSEASKMVANPAGESPVAMCGSLDVHRLGWE